MNDRSDFLAAFDSLTLNRDGNLGTIENVRSVKKTHFTSRFIYVHKNDVINRFTHSLSLLEVYKTIISMVAV